MVTQIVLAAWGLALAYEDWRWRRLPNVLLLAGIFLGVVHYLAYGSMPVGSSMAANAWAACLGLLALLPLYRMGWMAAGDIKLLAVIGWLGGLAVMLKVFILATAFGGVLALMLLSPCIRPFMASPAVDARRARGIPFGIALAVALLAVMGDGGQAAWLPL